MCAAVCVCARARTCLDKMQVYFSIQVRNILTKLKVTVCLLLQMHTFMCFIDTSLEISLSELLVVGMYLHAFGIVSHLCQLFGLNWFGLNAMRHSSQSSTHRPLQLPFHATVKNK